MKEVSTLKLFLTEISGVPQIVHVILKYLDSSTTLIRIYYSMHTEILDECKSSFALSNQSYFIKSKNILHFF